MAYSDIKDPSEHFQTVLYTGNGGTLSVTNDGNSNLQPDWVWIKNRAAYQHQVYDTNRGVHKKIMTSVSNAETTDTTALTAFNTDGFSTGANVGVNQNNVAHVAWQWKANGGTTASNSNGSITSTVQANTTAGFSIVTYTGTGSAATVGHGLGETPDMIIFKNRSDANVWATYHQGVGNNVKLDLSGTGAEDADGAFMNGTLPTSSVFSVGASANTNTSSSNYVAYCFKDVQGYSKFGVYSADYATSDGPFVYTGFKPAFVMIKNLAHATNWIMIDHKRNPSNVANLKLGANLNAADNGSDLGNTSQNNIDMLSNGFKIRTRNTDTNYNTGDQLIYMAFAENPFVAGGVPTTAR